MPLVGLKRGCSSTTRACKVPCSAARPLMILATAQLSAWLRTEHSATCCLSKAAERRCSLLLLGPSMRESTMHADGLLPLTGACRRSLSAGSRRGYHTE